jgi:lipoprotein LprG
MIHTFRIRPMLLALAVLLGACGAAEEDAAGGDAAGLDAEVVLERSAEAMASVETAEFTIEQSGAEVHIDEAGLIRFREATGRYAAPASADALLKVAAMGLDTEVGAVAVDGLTWISNPLTGRWESAPEGFSFDPSVLFDPETGWSALLAEGLENPTIVADGGERHHLRGVVDAERVASLTGGLVDEPSEIDLWIDPDTYRVDEVSFDVETDAGMTSWRLVLTGYDTDIVISEPAVGTDGD